MISKKVILVCALIAIILLPSLAFAQDSSFFGPLVPCGTQSTEPCNFNHLIQLVQNIINFAIAISVPIAAVGFMWAGFLYVTAAGSQGQIEKAHSIFKKIGIGFIIVLGAWLIVSTITSALIDPEAGIPTFGI